jgi:DNA polymerase I
VVCKDVDTGEMHVFREVTNNSRECERFLLFVKNVDLWIGHHIIGYDLPVLNSLLGLSFTSLCISAVIDTLVISKLTNYSRNGHSIEDYGIEFGKPKGKNHYLDFFKRWSQELEDYCIQDVEIGYEVYRSLLPIINNPDWHASINCEQNFQRVCNELHNNGFYFNSSKAKHLLENVTKDLSELDKDILDAFPPKLKLIREIHPKLTKYGTLHRGDFRWVQDGNLSEYNGGPFCRGEWVPFNPASPKQIVEVLNRSGWKPVDKTKTHIETARSITKLKYRHRTAEQEVEYRELETKLVDLQVTGWKVSEDNLSTLPKQAPSPARVLAKRILLESRRRTLTEWLHLTDEDSRIRGRFTGNGAWTARMSHQEPNMANIPNEHNVHDNSKKLLGGEMRALWRAPP